MNKRRSSWVSAGLVVCSVVASCKPSPGDAPSSSSPPGGVAAKQQDAMWALAPRGATAGVVLSSRGVELLERALVGQEELLAKLDAFFNFAAELELLPFPLTDKLAEHGLSSALPAAAFTTENDLVVILPVVDRAKLLAAAAEVPSEPGPRPGDVPGIDRLGKLSCKQVRKVYACATEPALLDTLGKGSLRAAVSLVGERGELELVASFPDVSATPPKLGAEARSLVAAVAQLEPGAARFRGVFRDPPPRMRALFKSPSKPRHDGDGTAGLLTFELRPMFAGFSGEVAPGVTFEALAGSIAGPVTATVPVGGRTFELQMPLSDPAPFARVIEACTALPSIGAELRREGAHCLIEVPRTTPPLSLELRVEGTTFHIAEHQAAGKPVAAPAANKVPLTALGRELAGGTWDTVLWGRGAQLGRLLFMDSSDPQKSAGLAAMRFVVSDLLRLLSEIGLGARLEGDTLHFTGGVRTIFTNPDEVLGPLLAVTPAEIDAGQGEATAKALAEKHPQAPFAADVRAGFAGVSAPLVLVSHAQALPDLLSTPMPRKSEAETMLEQLERASREHHARTGRFPKGTTELTPKASCCLQNFDGKMKCAPVASSWAAAPWKALGFAPTEPHAFQYSYSSKTGTTFLVTAVGDLDCDGTPITYELRGSSVAGTGGKGGAAEVELITPLPNSD